MKHKTINIEQIHIKPIDTPQHRLTLRQHLLTSSYWNTRKQSCHSDGMAESHESACLTRVSGRWNPGDINCFFPLKWTLVLKGGEKIMQKNKLLSSGIVLAAVAVVIGMSFILIPQNTKTAYAEQLAQQSYQKVSNLSPEELDALKQKVRMDPSELLQEAKTAKDLKTLTYDEFISQTPAKMGFSTKRPVPSDAPEMGTPEQMDLHNLKFLQFTDKGGNKVTLGIDQNNLPVFAFSANKDGSTFGIVHKAGRGESPMTGSVSIKGQANGETGTKDVMFINKNDQKDLIINGKKYPAPSGTIDKSTVQVKDGDVYINGVKTAPTD